MKRSKARKPRHQMETAEKATSNKHSRKRLSIRRELGQKVAETLEGPRRPKRHHEHGSSKYRPDYGPALLAYFNVDALKMCTDPRTGVSTAVFANWPTFEGFAASIGCVADTVRRWATEVDAGGHLLRPEFSASYARARELQQHLLQQGGMSGAYNSGFATLAAKNILGWKDKVESESSVRIVDIDPAALEAIYNSKRAESAEMNATRGRRAERASRW